MQEFTHFNDWKVQLLDRHELPTPDGRPLYLYRLTEDDFNKLEELLRKQLSQLLRQYDLSRVGGISGFVDLFVLYSSEWWRRRYDGSGFSWEPILRDIGADPEDWNPTQRSNAVRQGFRGWCIQLRESGGMRYIGSVAVQGGLPLKLLASSRGSIGQLLTRVLHLASGSKVTQFDLRSWVESLADRLPHSYREDSIYTLLADVAWTVLDLKDKASLQSSADAVDILNTKIPNWRDRFPLPVEDEYAQGMIEQLIRDAALVRIEKRSASLPVTRELIKTDNDRWVLRSRLDVPPVISTEDLGSLFSVDVEELPRSAQLSLQVQSFKQNTGIRRLAGQQKYRLEQEPLGFADDAASGEHILHMGSPDGRVFTVTARRGDELDDVLPWVFVEKDSLVFARQGSGNVTTPQALIALPDGWEIKTTEGSIIAEMGWLCSHHRRIISVQGVIRAQEIGGLTFRLRTGDAGATETNYEWVGDRYWLDFRSPNLAFRGLPVLHQVSENEFKARVKGQLGISDAGGSATSNPDWGPLYLRYPESGDVKYRSKVLVLPKTADVELNPRDAVSGTIRFRDWEIARVRVISEDIQQHLQITEDEALLDVAVLEDQRAPDYIELEADWLHSKIPAKFRLPFPAYGVRVFNGEGKVLSDKCLLAVQHLRGVRILVSGGHLKHRTELEILDATEKYSRRHLLRTRTGALSMEIKLVDFLADIQQLFSVNDLFDAPITVQIRVKGRLEFTLGLVRYSASLEYDGESIRIGREVQESEEKLNFEQLSVLALRLESPGDEAEELEPCVSEGVATGIWLSSPRLHSQGSWLVYPASKSTVPIRPTLLPIEGETEEDEGLSSAISVSNQAEREQRIVEVIGKLASDFHDEDWVKVEQMGNQLGHLPLPALDLWRCFATSSLGMAALALRFSNLSKDFIKRFPHELPFAWETIAFEDWQEAMCQLKAQCEAKYGESNGTVVFESYLCDRIQLLTSESGSLDFLLGIASKEVLPDKLRQVKALKHVGMKASQDLFVGETSKLMELRRLHADDRWPEEFLPVSSSFDLDSPRVESYLCTDSERFQTLTINIPIILAIQAVTGKTDKWFQSAESIYALRIYQAFDQDWFEEAYNQTVARCLADGLIEGTNT